MRKGAGRDMEKGREGDGEEERGEQLRPECGCETIPGCFKFKLGRGINGTKLGNWEKRGSMTRWGEAKRKSKPYAFALAIHS